MTSSVVRALADRILEEKKERRSEGLPVDDVSVQVAPFVYDILEEEMAEKERVTHLTAPTSDDADLKIHGSLIEPSDHLQAVRMTSDRHRLTGLSTKCIVCGNDFSDDEHLNYCPNSPQKEYDDV